MTDKISPSANEYFTCQCNPPPEGSDQDGYLLMHRIPIDCMTALDWQTLARAKQERSAQVWVVSVEGDTDCGYSNDGAIGVFANISDAWKLAMTASEEFLGEDAERSRYYKIDEEGVHLERGSYLVKKFNVG